MANISVITPFYKGNRFLENLSAIIDNASNYLKQDYPNLDIEWILVNDSPNDVINESLIHAKHYAYKIINHEKNQGIKKARCTGLAASTGNIIHFIDQDDEIKENFYDIMYKNYRKDMSDIVVCNGYNEFPDKVDKLYDKYINLKRIQDLNSYLKVSNPIKSPGQCLIKKEIIPQLWIDSFLKTNGSDDLMLWILLLKDNRNFSLVSDCLYIHKNSGVNLSDHSDIMTNSSNEVAEILLTNKVINKNEYNCLLKTTTFNTLSKKERRLHFFRYSNILLKRIIYKFSYAISKPI